MSRKVSKRLVIDASVARAAGSIGATAPLSRYCRSILQAILTVCHRVVFTTEITREWNTHQSRFARQWRVAMTARKKIYATESVISPALLAKIDASTPDTAAREAMRKDLLLIAAALATDKTILSLDARAQRHFAAASSTVGELRVLAWVNPETAAEQAVRWLQDGAKPERGFRFGAGGARRRARE